MLPLDQRTGHGRCKIRRSKAPLGCKILGFIIDVLFKFRPRRNFTIRVTVHRGRRGSKAGTRLGTAS
eukprot:3993272-Heterocapsa_arctica.AAC.1